MKMNIVTTFLIFFSFNLNAQEKSIVNLNSYGFSPDGRYYAFCVKESSLGGARYYEAVVCNIVDTEKKAIKEEKIMIGEGDLEAETQEELEAKVKEKVASFMNKMIRRLNELGIKQENEEVLYQAHLAKYGDSDTEVIIGGKKEVKFVVGDQIWLVKLEETFTINGERVSPEDAFDANWTEDVRCSFKLLAKKGDKGEKVIHRGNDKSIAHRIVRISRYSDSGKPVAIIEGIFTDYENSRIPKYKAVIID